MEFYDFKVTTKEGMGNRIFEISKSTSDYIPMHEFYDTKFINVERDALGYIYDPSAGWATINDCGEFPCSAPQNVLFSFKKNTF